MSARYLELDSTYRNRNQGSTSDGLASSPANFEVQICSGTSSLTNAVDPVSSAAPKIAWNNSFVENSYIQSITLAALPIALSTTNTLSGTTVVILTSGGGANIFREPDDFYNGAVLTLTTAADPVYRRIVDYRRLSTTTAEVYLDSALPATAFSGGTIDDPTGNTNVSTTTPLVFIPGGPSINNYYAGCLIHNLDDDNYVEIQSYDGTTHVATLADTTTTNWFNNQRNFVIATARASDTGSIPVTDNVNTIGGIASDGGAVQLASTASAVSDTYNESYLRISQPTIAGVAGTPATNEPYGSQVRIVDYIALDGTLTAGGAPTTTIVLSTGEQVDDFYVGALITINNGAGSVQTREIISYVGATRTAVVDQAFDVVVPAIPTAGQTFFIRTAELQSPISTTLDAAVAAGNSPGFYEVERVTSDNYFPLNYTGSLVSSSQMVCYEIELLNLILPNSTLVSGGRAAFYPYVYVVLENVGSGTSRAPGLIWSNNPNARKKLFRAVVDDTPTPLISPFIKIDGDGMVQTVKFKPNDSFRFAVFLPNGTLFETVEQDTSSPNPPNTLVQCSAVFSLKKL